MILVLFQFIFIGYKNVLHEILQPPQSPARRIYLAHTTMTIIHPIVTFTSFFLIDHFALSRFFHAKEYAVVVNLLRSFEKQKLCFSLIKSGV